MAKCPICGKPANGRICGYCGASLVENYFKASTKATVQYPCAGIGSLTSTIIGIIGGLILLAAAASQALSVYQSGSGVISQAEFFWWTRLLASISCGALFFVQQIVMRGLRFSILFDGVWLFLSTFGFGFSLLMLLLTGAKIFSESIIVTVLLLIGCFLCALSCIISIIVYRKPE